VGEESIELLRVSISSGRLSEFAHLTRIYYDHGQRSSDKSGDGEKFISAGCLEDDELRRFAAAPFDQRTYTPLVIR